MEMLTLPGFSLPDLVEGLLGGAAAGFAFRKTEPVDMTGSIIVGGLFGNGFAVPVSAMLGTTHEAAAFFVGVVAMPLCKKWVKSFKDQSK